MCHVPVVGVVERVSDTPILPGRHLGLVPPTEHGGLAQVDADLSGRVGPGLAMADILRLARSAGAVAPAAAPPEAALDGRGLRIGYLHDSAFTFYYPENLEQLTEAGADLVPISSLTDAALPPGLHGLYIGGGFPETHAVALAANRAFLDDLRRQAEAGLPIYAECGGLMLLAGALRQGDRVSPMAGVLPFDVELSGTPQGHGYAELTIDTPNPFFPVGLSVRGHEFHYSRIVPDGEPVGAVGAMRRGTGAPTVATALSSATCGRATSTCTPRRRRTGREACSARPGGSPCAPPPSFSQSPPAASRFPH